MTHGLWRALPTACTQVEAPQTNLLYFSMTRSDGPGGAFTAAQLVSACAREGIRFLVVPGAEGRMRMVCHHQIDAGGVERTLEVIERACREPDWVMAETTINSATGYAGGSK